MIALAADFLLFQLADGESVPFSAESISVQLLGETAALFDPEFVSHAAKAVFHYFKHELQRQSVTLTEFADALEKVLRGFKPSLVALAVEEQLSGIIEADLCELAKDSAQGCELLFFPRLRDQLREHLRRYPRVVRFHGLRGCVKHLTGAQRWTARCRNLEEQIVIYLRDCLGAEARWTELAVVVQ